jgi:hypothetical protein
MKMKPVVVDMSVSAYGNSEDIGFENVREQICLQCVISQDEIPCRFTDIMITGWY